MTAYVCNCAWSRAIPVGETSRLRALTAHLRASTYDLSQCAACRRLWPMSERHH